MVGVSMESFRLAPLDFAASTARRRPRGGIFNNAHPFCAHHITLTALHKRGRGFSVRFVRVIGCLTRYLLSGYPNTLSLSSSDHPRSANPITTDESVNRECHAVNLVFRQSISRRSWVKLLTASRMIVRYDTG